jgi:hypothetical protein
LPFKLVNVCRYAEGGAANAVVKSVNVQLRFVGRAAEMAVVEETCERILLTAGARIAANDAAAASDCEEEEEEELSGRGGGRGAFVAFHGVDGIGKTRVLREAANEVRSRGFCVLEPAAESGGRGGGGRGGGGRGGGGGGLRLCRSMFVDACRLLPGKTAVNIQGAALGGAVFKLNSVDLHSLKAPGFHHFSL